MAEPHLIVIGASAGGLTALTAIVEHLPVTLPACVLVVLHNNGEANGVLPQILSRVSALPVRYAQDHDAIRPGQILVAKPDFHLLVTEDNLRVLRGPRENGFRPAVDPLFRTAARAFGPRVIGVILSGALGDGTYGLSVVKHLGGTAVVQDPDDAVIGHMPASAIAHVDVDYVLPAHGIAAVIEELSNQPVQGASTMARANEPEPQLPSEPTEVGTMKDLYGDPSALTCPDCGGSLWEIEDGRVTRYQCHTGHQYAPDSLQAEQRDAVDSALWSAVRVLEEHADLKMRMAQRATDGGMERVAEGFEEGSRDAHTQAQQIRALLFSVPAGGNGAKGNGGPPAATREPARRRKTPAPARATASATTSRAAATAKTSKLKSPRRPVAVRGRKK